MKPKIHCNYYCILLFIDCRTIYIQNWAGIFGFVLIFFQEAKIFHFSRKAKEEIHNLQLAWILCELFQLIWTKMRYCPFLKEIIELYFCLKVNPNRSSFVLPSGSCCQQKKACPQLYKATSDGVCERLLTSRKRVKRIMLYNHGYQICLALITTMHE
jgi:hypothetical protein